MQLAHGRLLARAPGQTGARPSRSREPRPKFGNTRIVVTCGGASLVPLAGLVALILVRPSAPASDLLWPLVVVTIVATGLAVVGGLALSEPLHRSVVQLHRIARRALSADPTGLPLSSVAPGLRFLAQDVNDLGRELDRVRTELERTTRDLRIAYEGRESLVSSLAIANRRLRDEATVVHDFVETVNRPLDREQMCLQLLNALDDEVPYQEGMVCLTDPDTGRLLPAALCDRERNYRQAGRYLQQLPNYSAEVVSGRSLPYLVYQTGRPIIVADSRVDRRFAGLPENLRSFLGVPIEVKSRVIGALQIGAPEPNRYDDHDERQVATLAHFAALWIENVRLFQEAAKVEAYRKVDQLKSELLSTVSHELRTPLASIKGYASSLLREDVEWDPETRREFLQIIDEESDRLSSIIEDLLQMSEIEAGVLRMNKQPVKISRLAQKVAKKVRPHARDHSVSVSVASDVPETMGDPRRIEQILHNLVVNAIKYSPDGTPVTVRVERRADDILVAVRDLGIGIPPEHAEHVFERFYRVDGTLARRTGGSGLGLPICRGLVEAHAGRIWVESQVNKGSTFYFTIPIVATEEGVTTDDDRGALSPVGSDD